MRQLMDLISTMSPDETERALKKKSSPPAILEPIVKPNFGALGIFSVSVSTFSH